MLICSALHTLCLLCLKMLHLCLFKPERCSFQVMLFHMLFMPKYAERKASRMDKSLKMGARFQESVDLARFLKIRFLKMGRFQVHKIGFSLEIRKWPDFSFQESWISVP